MKKFLFTVVTLFCATAAMADVVVVPEPVVVTVPVSTVPVVVAAPVVSSVVVARPRAFRLRPRAVRVLIP